MSTFYAAFHKASTVQRMAADVLEDGTPSDDISVLAHQSYADLHRHSAAQPQTPPSVQDATDFVGARDDPGGGPSVQIEKRRLTEDYFQESLVGAGISTANPEDSISTVDEADDSQELAGQEIYERRSQGTRETMDLRRAVLTGFPTDIPRIDDFQPLPTPGENLDETLGVFTVPGLGVIMGGGGLATAALDNGDKARSIQRILRHFKENGVDDSTAKSLMEELASGGAILSVELSGGSDQAIKLESLAERYGALTILTSGAPRY